MSPHDLQSYPGGRGPQSFEMPCRMPFRRSAAELSGGVAAASARQEMRLDVLISGMAAWLSCAIWPLSRLGLCDPCQALFYSLLRSSGSINDPPLSTERYRVGWRDQTSAGGRCAGS
jgi:hypothetical protein